MNKLILVISGWLALGMTAQAASFDCQKAQSKVEHLICDDPEISKLDDELSKTYQDDLSKANDKQKQQLITEQKHWLKNTRNVCQDITCLKLAYWSRQAALATFFEPKSPLYEHEADKAEAIKQVLATAQLELIGGATGVPNFCAQMLDDLKQMKGIRFVDPVVQAKSYEDPALDNVKQHCGAKPPLHFSRWCEPRIDIPNNKEGFEEGLAECNVGFGLPPFKLYELAPIEPTDVNRVIFYSDDVYGPMNLSWKKPLLGGGFSGFRQVDPNKCEQVERNGTGMSAGISADVGRGARSRKNYNSIIEYKNQYYFLVLNKPLSGAASPTFSGQDAHLFDAWWLAIQTVTPFRSKNQKTCNWSPVIPESTSNQGSK